LSEILKVKGLGEGKRDWHRGFLIGIGLLLLFIILLNTPLFSMKTFIVEGNERVETEDIMRDLDLSYGTNLFRYALTHHSDDITVDSRLSTVDVYFRWPSTVRVVVEESETIGYVYFQGTYLCIDRKGQVATSTNTPDEDIPIITGMNVGSFSIGDSLGTDDTERYEAVMTIGTNLRKYEIVDQIKEVNVRVLDDIVMRTEHLEIRLGDINDMGGKINIVAEILKTSGVPDGVLHIEDIDEEIYLEVAGKESGQSTGATAGE